jgi:hypothetical protein
MVLVAVSLAAFSMTSCSPAEACGGTISVEIVHPSSGLAMRGDSCAVTVHAWTTGNFSVKTIQVFYKNVQK